MRPRSRVYRGVGFILTPLVKNFISCQMSEVKYKPSEEWFKLTRHGLEKAEAVFKAERYIYTVFMCHLSIEKALKGLYAKCFEKDPIKTHDLNYLCDIIGLNLSEEHQIFLDSLNDISVPVRYPDDIKKIVSIYKKSRTERILNESKELLKWLRKKL